ICQMGIEIRISSLLPDFLDELMVSQAAADFIDAWQLVAPAEIDGGATGARVDAGQGRIGVGVDGDAGYLQCDRQMHEAGIDANGGMSCGDDGSELVQLESGQDDGLCGFFGNLQRTFMLSL